MIYGLFVFSVDTAPFDRIERDTSWRWPSNNRTGADIVYQYTGRGEDTISLSGVLMPEISGGPVNLDMLRRMGDRGEPYLLMGGNGDIYGYYIIEQLREGRSYLLADGTAQKIEFTLTLKRYAGNEQFGLLAPLLPLLTRLF
ncbi:phage tail protein [Rappaport israeli]|uniref:phage tail protein n=1 Tax=Rappaport israeli TaxID=1839807 RepID=UPI001E4A2984|nr:phage tail protein [Rappaport israeli]